MKINKNKVSDYIIKLENLLLWFTLGTDKTNTKYKLKKMRISFFSLFILPAFSDVITEYFW